MLNVTLGSPQRHQSLTVFPLLAQDAPALPYTLMSDALQHGILRITEVGSGTVPELLALNSGESAILVLDGEQLIGARQNRTTNRSLLLPAKSETKIPVSCMEQGRWRFDSEQFAPTKHSSPSTVRRRAREVEAERVAAGAEAAPEVLAMAQGEVWDAIREHSAHLGAHSETGALNDLFATRAEDLDAWLRAFSRVERQVGLLAFLGPRPLGMDLIGCARLYERMHERLLHGYVMDALGSTTRARKLGADAAQGFLDRVAKAGRVDSPTVGLGRYAVLAGEVIGGELKDGDRVVHLSAFPAAEHGDRDVGPIENHNPIAPPSRRRRG